MVVSSGTEISIGEPGRARLQMGVAVGVWVSDGKGVKVRVAVSSARVKEGEGEVLEAVGIALAFSVRPAGTVSRELAAVEVSARASIRLGRLHAARVAARARQTSEGQSFIIVSSFYRTFKPYISDWFCCILGPFLPDSNR
jgi:hypothetical protein